jgi:hypothetical protein
MRQPHFLSRQRMHANPLWRNSHFWACPRWRAQKNERHNALNESGSNLIWNPTLGAPFSKEVFLVPRKVLLGEHRLTVIPPLLRQTFFRLECGVLFQIHTLAPEQTESGYAIHFKRSSFPNFSINDKKCPRTPAEPIFRLPNKARLFYLWTAQFPIPKVPSVSLCVLRAEGATLECSKTNTHTHTHAMLIFVPSNFTMHTCVECVSVDISFSWQRQKILYNILVHWPLNS